jgi:hypothetical protein
MGTEAEPEEREEVDAGLDAIDLALADTFPASDPPSWNLGRDRRRAEAARTDPPPRR